MILPLKYFNYIQWNLAIPAKLGTNESGWISEVAGFQSKLLMYKRMDESFGAGMFGCNNEVDGVQRPRIARFHCFTKLTVLVNQQLECYICYTMLNPVTLWSRRTSLQYIKGKKRRVTKKLWE